MNVFIVVMFLVCLSVRLSVRALTFKRVNRFTSNLIHIYLGSRPPSLVTFSLRGQTPWGQEGVKVHMLTYGQKFLLHNSIEGSKENNFYKGTTGQTSTIWGQEGVKGHVHFKWRKLFTIDSCTWSITVHNVNTSSPTHPLLLEILAF